MTSFMQEVAILKGASTSPHILKFMGACVEEDAVILHLDLKSENVLLDVN